MYAQKKSIENVHIVRERDRQRFRELLAVLALGAPIGLFLLLFTWQNLEVIRLGHEATRLQKTRKEIEDSNKALQLDLERLTSFESVEQKATALGFAPTDPRSIVMINGQPTTAAEQAEAIVGEPTQSASAPASNAAIRPLPLEPPAARHLDSSAPARRPLAARSGVR